jgi:hydrogenase expression/formation protein HypE
MSDLALSCPAPLSRYPAIVMAHGGGGRLMRDLIQAVFVRAFGPTHDTELHDAARLAPAIAPHGLALTTDAYVVTPLFFPGCSIGELAVYGTVNDLAMAGARPTWLSAAFVLEEGLPVADLVRVVAAMRDAASATGVHVATGDTKVVERGRCDGMYITTSGVGILSTDLPIGPTAVREGDAVLLSGDLGRHGIAVMAEREGFRLGTTIQSDCAPLWAPVNALLDAAIEVHCMRDLTRGGLASALVEIAETARVTVAIRDCCVPVSEEVRSACELLGFDPMHVANEGRFVAFVPESHSDEALELLCRHPVSSGAVRLGSVRGRGEGLVLVETVGGERPLDMLSGELLPRIC